MKKAIIISIFSLGFMLLNAQDNIRFNNSLKLIDHPSSQAVLLNYPFLPLDYNGDGLLDLIGASFGDLWFYKGYTDLVFEEINTDPVHSGLPLKAMDFDNDGDMDVVLSSYIYQNDSEDNFSVLDLGIGGGNTVVEANDFNNDGYNDVLVHSEITFEPDVLSIYFNNGDNTFTQETILNNYDRYSDIDFGDIDNDGDIDFVVGLKFENKPFIILENNAGQYIERDVPYDFEIGNTIYLKDTNQDGNLDIIASGLNEDIYLMRNVDNFISTNGMRRIDVPFLLFFNMTDLNGDSHPDIVALTSEDINPKIKTLESWNGTNYGPAQVIGQLSFSSNTGAPNSNYLSNNLSFFDVNGDGKKDLVYTQGFGNFNTVRWQENISDYIPTNIPTLSSEVEISIYPNPTSKMLKVDHEDQFTELNFQIYDINGKVCLNGKTTNNTIEVEALSIGTYFIQFKNSGERIKFLKH